MDEKSEQLCPWCQTLINWDPEIGPEEECPHCYNKLGGYRTLNVKLGRGSEDVLLDDDDDDDDDDKPDDDFRFSDDPLHLEELEDFRSDEYGEAVQQIVDEQDEAPECPSCHDFMLLTGSRKVADKDFTPHVPKSIGTSFLKAPFTIQIYICPHCFRVDSVLSEDDRQSMTKLLHGDA